MIEKMLRIMRSFFSMLNTKVPETTTEDNWLKADEMYQILKKIPKEGIQLRNSVDHVTPLMFYAFFNITDDRFINSLKENNEKYIARTIKLSNSTGISALTLAATTGSLSALKLLFESKHFSQEHLEEAVYFAASFDKAECVSYLHSKGIYLFHQMFFERTTPLYAACAGNYAEVVQTILDTNPPDEYIGLRFPFCEEETAYEIAKIRENIECVKLLENTKSAIWDKKIEALRNNNLGECLELIAKDNSKDPFIGDYHRRDECLITFAAAFSLEDIKYRPTYERLILALAKYPVETQINALLNCVSALTEIKKHPRNISHSMILEVDTDLISRLNDLDSHFNEIKNLAINGLCLDEQLLNLIKKIIYESEPIKIDFTSYTPDFLDEETGEACTLNLWPSDTAKFISTILTNKRLVDCNLLTDSSNMPLLELLNLVIERNKLIQIASLGIVKDKIYDHYVSIINNEINRIKTRTKTQNAECLVELKPTSSVYSLTHLTAFFAANTNKIKATNVPPEVDSIIISAKMPPLKK